MDRIILFFIISLLLGFIITYFYNNELNKDFFLIFIIISIILFIIFYYLAQTNEYYSNYINEAANIYTNLSNNSNNRANLYNDSIINTNYIIRDSLDSEVNDYIKNTQNKLGINQNNDIEYIPSEEMNVKEEVGLVQSGVNQLAELISNNILKPDFSNYFMKTPIPTQTPPPPAPVAPVAPVNININYGGGERLENNNISKSDNNKPKNNNNLGNANCSRIYNNSDWIYGDNAWTTKPDYYIPDISESKYTNCNSCDSCKDCCKCNKNNNKKPLNESIRTKRSKNEVAPIMINVPWTEYKSGDMDPEPYNL